MTPTTQGRKIRAARKALGLSRLEFGAMIGVNPITLWRWEKGAAGYGMSFALARRVAARKLTALRRDRAKVQRAIARNRMITAIVTAARLADHRGPF